MVTDVINRVLAFWFVGNSESHRKAWFIKSASFDDEIKSKFEDELKKASSGEYDNLTQMPRGVLTLMILLDQFPRNIYRGSPKAFATDFKALEIAKVAIANALDLDLNSIQRVFLYLPFEHSENMDDQNRAIELFQALGDESFLRYAIAHRRVIKRFGRFPHRNKVLIRKSTEEEIEFLENFRGF